MRHILLFTLLFLSACASVPTLDPAAAKVEVVDYIKPGLRAKLEELDQVKCQLGQNARTWETNVEGCKNQFRNEAAKMGGTLVLVTDSDIKKDKATGGVAFMSGTTNCENCVNMRGVVYKAK